MIVKPAISFLNRDPDATVHVKVMVILAAMTGNANFPMPTPPLSVVQVALDEFGTATADASDGGKTLTARKNAKRKALAVLIRALAGYVQTTCDGNYTMLLSSGFPTHKPTRSAVGALPAPTGLKLSLGLSSGELDASLTPIAGAILYSWRVTTGESKTLVNTSQTSAANTTFAGLKPGVIYEVTANAIGTAGPSDWTHAVAQMVV